MNDASDPLLIHIKVADGQLHFQVRNKKSTGTKEKSRGIGLPNIKNRLALAYPNEHSLTITDIKEYYIADLTVNLSQ